MSKRIFITRKIPRAGVFLLKKKGYKVTINPYDRVLTKKEILRYVKGKDALLSLLTDKIDAEIMEAGLPTLKIIANYAVGYNNIDVKAAKERGILVTNTPGVLTETTAEFTMALMLAIARRVVEGDKFTRAGKFKGWGPMLLLGSELKGKTLGIIGMGQIGTAVAKMAIKGFGMRVVCAKKARKQRSKKAKKRKESGIKCIDFKTLLKCSDFVSLHVPLTKETHHLIGAKELQLMKKSAYLINVARGAVVDEQALVRALCGKQIKGAALDVFEFEPKLVAGLKKLDNVVLAPHLGSATVEARNAMAEMAAKNVIAALSGKRPPNSVTHE